MSVLRTVFRLPLMVATVVAFFALWALGLPWVAFSDRRWAQWRAFILRQISRWLLWAFGARVEVHGSPPLPPFLLVSNHQSYIDILLLASRLDTVFVSKHEVAGWPVLGVLCRLMGTVFINRESRRDLTRVIDEIHRTLSHGTGIVVFPEGTSTNGQEVLAFRPSLLETAVRLQQPVAYASVRYSTGPEARSAADTVCWWGDQAFMPHFFNLVSMPGFRAELYFGPRPIASSDRKLLAHELREAVAGQLSS
jgi:1-acyl-sn-glycerol-3-phosphate acyltransferase